MTRWPDDRFTVSFKELVERLPDGPDTDQFALPQPHAIRRIDIGFGHDAALESHLRRFADAQRRLRDAADFAGQADLAEHRGGLRNDAVSDARRDGGDDA